MQTTTKSESKIMFIVVILMAFWMIVFGSSTCFVRFGFRAHDFHSDGITNSSQKKTTLPRLFCDRYNVNRCLLLDPDTPQMIATMSIIFE